MTSYSVVFKPSVQKDLRRLPKATLARVLKRLEELGEQPLPRQATKLAGAERLYRVRVGEYRIVYEVESNAQRLTIHVVRHRREVYRDL